MSSIEEDGAISVEGEYVGRIRGFQFVPDGSEGSHGKTLRAASLKTVAHEIGLRAQAVAAAPDTDLELAATGDIVWQQTEIARLTAGANVLKPRLQLLAGDQLAGSDRDAVQLRLEHFLRRRIAAVLEPMVKLAEAEDVAGLARGLAFRVVENLGVVSRDQVAEDVKSLSQEDRASLRKYGVRFGAFHIFIPALLKPAATQLRLLLWALGLERDGVLSRHEVPATPGQGLTSVPFDRATPKGFYRIIGFRVCGARAVRIDMLERLGDVIRARVFWKPAFPKQPRPEGSVPGGGFTVIPDMMSLVGCSGEEFEGVLRSLGFRAEERKVPVESKAVVAATPSASTEASAEAPAVSPEPGSEMPDPAAQPPGGPQPAEAEGSTEAQTAEVVQVWWPKETGPFRKQSRPGKPREGVARGKSGRHPKAKSPDAMAKPNGKQEPRQRATRSPRGEQPPSDSPFAVLGALKAQLTGRKG